MRISDWSSDVCSSDLHGQRQRPVRVAREDQQVAIFVFHVVLRCALTVAVGGDDACVAGAAGFEPANARIKTWCLGPLGDAPADEACFQAPQAAANAPRPAPSIDRKSTRLNSSH